MGMNAAMLRMGGYRPELVPNTGPTVWEYTLFVNGEPVFVTYDGELVRELFRNARKLWRGTYKVAWDSRFIAHWSHRLGKWIEE